MKHSIRIKSIETLPENFNDFRDNLSNQLGALFGADASASIKSTIKHSMNAQLHQDNVLTWAAVRDDGKTVGLLFMALHGCHAKITLLSILPDYRNRQIETRLMEKAINTVRQSGITTILFEMGLDDVWELDEIQGIQVIPRIMMRVPASDLAAKKQDAANLTRPIDKEHLSAVAVSIVRAYQNHPDSIIYRDVRENSEAAETLEQAMKGNFGQTYPQWMRMIWDGRLCRGGVIATRLFPETVFILQLFVYPEYQRQGNGSMLLAEVANAIEAKTPGDNIVLCVSEDNPAQHLYTKLGFKPVYKTLAYFWENIEGERISSGNR